MITEIKENAVYDDESLRNVFGFSVEALKRSRKEGALRYSENGARLIYLGKWIIKWLDETSIPNINPYLNSHVEILRLSVRALNALESENIQTIEELVSNRQCDLLKIRNFGDCCLVEVMRRLEELGLELSK